jgi:hypothetical protein
MKIYFKEWYKGLISIMGKHKISIGITLLILIISLFTNEFELLKGYYLPPVWKTFLYLIPVFLVITMIRTGIKFSVKYQELKEILENRKAKDACVLKLKRWRDQYIGLEFITDLGDVMKACTECMKEAGLPESVIYDFITIPSNIPESTHFERKIRKIIVTYLNYDQQVPQTSL